MPRIVALVLVCLALGGCDVCYSDSDPRCYTESIYGAESSRLAGSQVDFIARRGYDKLPISAGIRMMNLPYNRLSKMPVGSTAVPVDRDIRSFLRSVHVHYVGWDTNGRRFIVVDLVRAQGDTVHVSVPIEAIARHLHARYSIQRPEDWKGWYPGRACTGFFTNDVGTQFTIIAVDDLSPKRIAVPADRIRYGAPAEDACD
jgi:hypothetical protein